MKKSLKMLPLLFILTSIGSAALSQTSSISDKQFIGAAKVIIPLASHFSGTTNTTKYYVRTIEGNLCLDDDEVQDSESLAPLAQAIITYELSKAAFA